jgi:hypothetical protein
MSTHLNGGIVCDDGKVMCELCFVRFPQDKLFVDAAGQRWNSCKPCETR